MDGNIKKLNKIFTLMPCVEKIPYQIECITCFKNIFILGLNSGQLLIYSINQSSNTLKYEVDLIKSIKSITKKAIQQLKAIYVDDYGINLLIALFESQIHIFDLQTYQHKYSLAKTKGALLFTISINFDSNLLYLIIVCKRRLQFFYLNMNNRQTQFMELINDIELTDTPKTIEFTQNNILCFSLKKDYFKFELPLLPGQATSNKSLDLKEVFSVGTRSFDPLCYKMNDSNVAFCIENQVQESGQFKYETIILDSNLQPHLRYPLMWSASPTVICNTGPFMIGLLPQLNSIEILTIKPKSMSIQIIDFNGTSSSNPLSHTQQSSNASLFSTSTPTSFLSSLKENLNSKENSSSNLKDSLAQDRIRHLISNGNNSICYVATQNNVWCLIPSSLNEQLDNLIHLHSYSNALNLIDVYEMYNSSVTDERQHYENTKANIFLNDKLFKQSINNDLIIKIQHLNAFDLYKQKQFVKSMKLFEEFKSLDPTFVISFIPGLLPDLKRQELVQILVNESLKLPELTSHELESAIECLIDYLQFKRKEFINHYNLSLSNAKNSNSTFQLFTLIENKLSSTKLKQLLEIIDTTLLQCYLKIREQLVQSLLRREQTFFHLETSEKLLKQHNKLSELLILYERKEKHDKALQLLVNESTRNGSPLFGHQNLINYLKRLGNINLDLIFKYAKSLLESLSIEGLKIFISIDTLNSSDLLDLDSLVFNQEMNDDSTHDDDDLLRQLDRKKICEFILNEIEPKDLSMKLLYAYVEYCIYKWKDKSEYINSLLVKIYKSKLNEFSTSLKLKEKLLMFLSDTNEYDIQKALSQFDVDSEERAILMGKLGKHEEALKIYVYKLNDTQKAEHYCKQVFKNPKKYPNSSQIYFYLLNMYLKSENYEQRNLNSIKLLNEYSQEIASNASVVNLTLDMLPNDINLSQIQSFINIMLFQSNKSKHSFQLMKNLLFSLNLQINELKLVQQSTSFVLNEEKCCYKCNKRIGKSAIVRYPNNTIIHYGCCKDSNILNIP